jgi:6-pyruvoyltetrahydropterin/6-carboxytetrahydropterin synthase
MVTDFRHLEWLKRWLNEYVDHRFVIDRCDPLIHGLIGRALGYTGGFKDVKAGPEEIVCASQIHLDVFNPGTPEYEMAEGMLIVDFVPTSENLSKWIADIVAPNMAPLEVRVAKVEWWETPKSVSVYIPDKVEEIKIE